MFATKKLALVIVFARLVCAFDAVASAAEMRTWTSAGQKFTVEAEFVELTDGVVHLRKADGKILKVPIDKLSDEDQALAQRLAKPQSQSSSASEPKGDGRLELKRVDLASRGSGKLGSEPWTMLCQPQTVVAGRSDSAFKKAVTKEPVYACPKPFRGVAKLGDHSYGFALDASSPKGFDRLFFDVNRNGDLTDDKPFRGAARAQAGISMSTFPRIDLTIQNGGADSPYSFYLSPTTEPQGKELVTSVAIQSAAYRDGHVTLNGKPTRIVALDANSNGIFNDLSEVNVTSTSHPISGDVLMASPDKKILSSSVNFGLQWPGVTLVGKRVCLDGQFFDLTLSASGDTVSLSPLTKPVGYLTNPHPGFYAVISGQQGEILNITGGKEKIPVPEGSWRLVSYVLYQPAPKTATLPGGKKAPAKTLTDAERKAQSKAGLAALASGRGSMVAAIAPPDYPAVSVRSGETAELPFGPAFKAKTVATASGAGRYKLNPVVVGSMNERFVNIMVNGARPAPPEFLIIDSKGKTIDRAGVEYG